MGRSPSSRRSSAPSATGCPLGSRLHAVGVGTGVNRALLASAARAGRGVEVIVDLDEAPERGVERILAATAGPVLTDVEIDGSAVTGKAPRRVPDLLSGAPVLAGVRLLAEGGDLTVRARSAAGAWSRTIAVKPTAPGEGSDAITFLYGREAIEDLEMDRAAGSDRAEIDRTIERIGLEFGLASRLTSWVAISEEPTVDPRQPIRTERMPQELPYGLSAEGLGFRFAAGRGLIPGVGGVPTWALSAADRAPLLRDRKVGISGLRAGALGKLRDALFKRGDEVPPTREQEPAMDDRRSRLPVSGRWLAGPSDDVQVLEVEVKDRPIDWQPPARVRLTLRDGRQIDCDLDSRHTTAAARLEPGMAFRIALRVAADVRKTVMVVEILLGQETVSVLLP